MICELYNKMDRFGCFVFNDTHINTNKVGLGKFIITVFMVFVVLFFMSWWLVPIVFVGKKLNNIAFYCKKGEQNG